MKRTILNVMIALSFIVAPAGLLAGNAYAACGHGSSAKDQVLTGIGQTGSDCSSDGVTNAISAAVTILSIVAGIAAVIAIIIAGFKYITSGGDSGKVANAKSTLIYALVGLVVAALAQFLVHFVLAQSATATLPPCPADHSIVPPNCRP